MNAEQTKWPKFSDLLGKTLREVRVAEDKERVTFVTEDGESFSLYHNQDCCESVSVEDVTGNLADLIGSPLTMADESSSTDRPADRPIGPNEYVDSETWTFYKLATVKGYVDIRWLGSSNGYYSESVDFTRNEPETK